MLNSRVADICQPALTVQSTTTVENVLQDVDWNEVSSVVVEDEDKQLVGVITERDMIFAESLGVKKRDLKAWEICSKKLVTIPPEETLRGAILLMIENKVHHVLVMTGEYLEGVITSFDVMKQFIDEG